MTLRTRLSALEKNVHPDDDSHLTDEELREQIWELFAVLKASHGEAITAAEEQLFRSDPERALVESARWKVDHWSDGDPDLKEEYRRLAEAMAASLESRKYGESVRRRIMEEYEQ